MYSAYLLLLHQRETQTGVGPVFSSFLNTGGDSPLEISHIQGMITPRSLNQSAVKPNAPTICTLHQSNYSRGRLTVVQWSRMMNLMKATAVIIKRHI